MLLKNTVTERKQKKTRWLWNWSLIRILGSPENDNESIEDVEAVADVPKETIGQDLKAHLCGEEDTEHDVAVLQDLRQCIGLWHTQTT